MIGFVLQNWHLMTRPQIPSVPIGLRHCSYATIGCIGRYAELAYWYNDNDKEWWASGPIIIHEAEASGPGPQ